VEPRVRAIAVAETAVYLPVEHLLVAPGEALSAISTDRYALPT
jgi:hypothetical protein